ncbi:hypothetical protein BVG16_27500 [Paenibacillus selenitireducens]|uniref:Uncharacterized protein n=1 Tax=Paenibacillus selenitireducens TaxID=1324314 RepID=A0A1T2X1Y0_9BACL|nr:hypothetical protein BVG16_27500 [Paenibacillus selenitireducens]
MIGTFRVMDASEIIILILFTTLLVLDLTSSVWKKWLPNQQSQNKNQDQNNNQQTTQPQQDLLSNASSTNQQNIPENP